MKPAVNRPAPQRRRSVKPPQDAARSAFREELQLAAEHVFAERGFAATKMADIAREAEVGVGTLYNYFASKQDIFEAIFMRRGAEHQQLVDRAIEGKPPLEQLRAFLTVSLQYLEDHGALFAMYLERGAISETDITRLGGKAIEASYERFLRKLEKTVQAAIDAGELRADIVAPVLVAALAGARNGAAYAWLRNHQKPRLSQMAEPLLELFLSGAQKESTHAPR